MSRLYLATGTGWQRNEGGLPEPTDPRKVRLTGVSMASGAAPGPPAPIQTIFGYNTLDSSGPAKFDWFVRCPISRCYPGGNLSLSQFNPGGFFYRAAGLDRPGVVSSKRINMSFIYDPRQVTSSNSSIAVQVKNFVQGVPEGWQVQFVMYHEYNLHTNGPGGRNDIFKNADGSGGVTNADFINSFKILSQVIYDWGGDRVIPVINPVFFGWQDQNVCPASEVAPTTQLHWDLYDNPSGNPPGYKQYGTQYHDMKKLLDPAYQVLVRLGYLTGQHGWGVNEFNSPRRVAPRQAQLNTTLGWGPLSPQDLDGTAMANAITAYTNQCLNYPVPPTTLIIFIYEAGTNFNQSFTTGGRHDPKSDDYTDIMVQATDANGNPVYNSNGTPKMVKVGENRGPLYQGYPIPVDHTAPMLAWKHFIDISA